MTMQEWSRKMDSFFTSTWYDVRSEVVDQVFQIIPLYNLLFEKSGIKAKAPEGTHWEIPVQTGKLNQNSKWFSKGANFSAQDAEFMTTLLYQIRYLGTSVTRYWVDDDKNRGKAKIIDYAKQKLENTKASLMDTLEEDSFAQNADPNAMIALPTLISTTPTSGTVGGLDRSQNPWMANQAIDFTGKTFATDFLPQMTKLFNNCSKFKGGSRRTPDIIIMTQDIYEKFENIANALQQIVTSNTIRASLGFGNISFKNVETFWAPRCTSGVVYMLNSEHLALNYNPNVYFEMTDWKPIAGTSLDKVAQIVLACQLTTDCFQKQGVLYNVS